MAGVGKYRQNEAVDVIGSAVCEPQKQAYAGGRYAFRNSRRFGGRYALETGADRRQVQAMRNSQRLACLNSGYRMVA